MPTVVRVKLTTGFPWIVAEVDVAVICSGVGLRKRVTKNPTATAATTTPATRIQNLDRMVALPLCVHDWGSGGHDDVNQEGHR